MTTSALVSSWYLTYRMDYKNSTYLLSHNYYINPDVLHNFILVVMATFHPYTVSYLITLDDYIRVRYFPSCISILFLYIELDHFFAGLELFNISNNYLPSCLIFHPSPNYFYIFLVSHFPMKMIIPPFLTDLMNSLIQNNLYVHLKIKF